MDTYDNWSQLIKYNKIDKDFTIESKYGMHELETLILAIHGGGIEYGTTEIAKFIAGDQFHYYSFVGKKKNGNDKLHITSDNFDEPLCQLMLNNAKASISIHGCKDDEDVVFIGGLDTKLISLIKSALQRGGFNVQTNEKFSALNEQNIVNKSKYKKGVQLEISANYRKQMFENYKKKKGRRNKTPMFFAFVLAINYAIGQLVFDDDSTKSVFLD